MTVENELATPSADFKTWWNEFGRYDNVNTKREVTSWNGFREGYRQAAAALTAKDATIEQLQERVADQGAKLALAAEDAAGLEELVREAQERVKELERALNWERHDVPHIERQLLKEAEARIVALTKALRELVACKDLKVRIIELADPHAPDSPELSVINADYKRRQPLAWESARRALTDTGTQTEKDES